jgi:hypothetical protein
MNIRKGGPTTIEARVMARRFRAALIFGLLVCGPAGAGAHNGRTWLDTAGHEHSDRLRPTERLEKNGETLKWTVTFDDPVFFTRPWSLTRTFTKVKADDRILQYTCTENNRDVQHLTPNQPNLDYKRTPEP